MKLCLTLALLITTAAFSCGNGDWPGWAQDLASSLRCGMDIEQVQHLAGTELTVERRLREFGSHTIRRDNAKLWLDFKDGRLQSVMLSRPMPWKLKGVYMSPQKNLCSGELSFFLRLNHLAELEGATVYLDGDKVEDFPWGYPFEISSGAHELRIEKKGYEPIIKRLDFDKDDPGELWMDITAEDVDPL